jgi:pyruvate kinase
MRRTKIVATLGPATDDSEVLDSLLTAGVDVVRINYSHGPLENHTKRIEQLRERAQARDLQIGVIADLQGPKIRIERFHQGAILLKEGEHFALDTDLGRDEGDEYQVGVTYRDLPRDVTPGDILLVDDGRIVLKVEGVTRHRVECKVLMGGLLSNNKGLNREGGGLCARALTPKDEKDIHHAVEYGADYVAVSFPRNGDDIKEARRWIEKADGKAGVIAKIERAEALSNSKEILKEADGIMIARGDLGVEIGDAALPAVQKRLIKLARDMNRVVITATQMMESMIQHPIPTRAEVFDVANAVLDGTDAVMLSAETSVGRYPKKAVEAMARICLKTEIESGAKGADYRLDAQFGRIDEAIAMATMYAANHINARAIVALTETGSTCMWMSRVRSGIPIFAFTRRPETLRKVTLYGGVYPIPFDVTHTDFLQINREMIDILLTRGAVAEGDNIIITKGDLRGIAGGTNGLKIVRVGQAIDDTA